MRLNCSTDNPLRLRATQTEFNLRPPLALLPPHQFQTFLVTYMNVYDTDGRAAVGDRFGLQSEKDFEQWFLSRVDRFLETTATSVQAMNQPPETWLLLVDEGMPEYAEELRRRVSHVPYAVLCPIPRPTTPRTASIYYSNAPLSLEIAKRIRSDARYVMTILLDNDDCLHRDYIKQALFYAGLLNTKELESAHIINFPHGLKWTRDFIYPMTLYSNPYLAFVEPAEWYQSAPHRHLTGCQRMHGSLNQCGILHDFPLEEPMWLRQYHEKNWLKPDFTTLSQHPLENIKPLLGYFGLQHLAPPQPSHSYVLAAKHLAQSGNAEDAFLLLNKAQQLAPDWAPPAYEEAQLWKAKNNNSSAIEACRRWTALSGEHPHSTYQSGLICLQLGEMSHGRTFLEKAFAKQPGLACERVEFAPDASHVLRTQHSDWPWFWYQVGLMFAQQQRHADALKAFASAMELSPSWPEPYYAAADAAFQSKDYAAVHALAQKALALRPFWPQLLHLIGKSHMQEQRWADAADALFKATEQQLNVTDPNYDLAMALVWLGRIDEAEISIGDALICDSERAGRLFEFSNLLKTQGYAEKAQYWGNIANLRPWLKPQ
jgi:tetratricopeptide (TPR) repeat protein